MDLLLLLCYYIWTSALVSLASTQQLKTINLGNAEVFSPLTSLVPQRNAREDAIEPGRLLNIGLGNLNAITLT